MRKHTRFWIAFFMASVTCALFTVNSAEAYQVKRVIRGTMALGTNEVVALDLADPNGDANYADGYLGNPPVTLDTTKCFIYITASSGTANSHTIGDVFAVLDDEQNMSFIRYTGTATTVDFNIVEFVSGVTVTSGITVFSDANSASGRAKTITFADNFDLTKTFPIINWKSYTNTGATGNDDKYQFTAEFTAVNKLKIQRAESAGNYRADMFYQVVNFDEDVFVQRGAVQHANNSLTSSVNLNNAPTYYPVDIAQSFLITYFRAGHLDGDTTSAVDGEEPLAIIDGYITDTNTLTFTRGSTSATAAEDPRILWYLVEFQDQTYSQKGRAAMSGAANTDQNQAVSAIVLNRTFPIISTSYVDNESNTSGMEEVLIRARMTSTTNMAFLRDAGTLSSNASVSWYVTELPPVKVVYPDGGETLTVGTQYNVQWEFADDLQTSGTACSGGVSTYHDYTIEAYAGGAYRTVAQNLCPAATGNTISYNWTVPDVLSAQNTIGTTARLRIFSEILGDPASNRSFDVSNADFTIVGNLALTEPTGGELWLVGDTNKTIEWTQNGNLGDIKINISTNGTTWNDGTPSFANSGGRIATITPAVGTTGPLTCTGSMADLDCVYTYNPVADLASTAVKVRLLPVIKDMASSTNPNGTLIVFTSTAHGLAVGETVRITGHDNPALTGGDVTGVVSASNYAANTFSLTGVNGNNGAAGTATGTISRGVNGTSLLSQTSPTAFEIRPSITVSGPLSTDQFNRGKAYTYSTTPKTIYWTTNGTVPQVDIWLSYDSGSSYSGADKLANDIGLCGSYPCYTNPSGNIFAFDWTLSPTQTLSTNTSRVAVVKHDTADPLAPSIGDESPNSSGFSIIGSLSQTAPVAAQANPTWKVGGTGPITWTVGGGSGVTLVDVQYATNCTGVNCTTTGTWANLPGGGGLGLTAGDNGWTWPSIDTSLQGTAVGIRIQDQSNPTNIYDQKGPFSVKMGLSAIKSGGSNITAGQIFRVGTGYSISWTNSGTPPGGGLSLYYNINGGSYTAFSPSLTGLTNSATVTFPDSGFIDDNVTLKVFDPNDGADAVNGVVLISPSIKVKANITNVTLKKGGDVSANYNYNNVMEISWDVSPAGYTDNVDILFTKDNGTDNYGLPGTGQKIVTVPATPSTYNWTINRTDVITGSASDKIRVVKSNDTDVVGESGAFQVKGRLLINEPSGSPWLIGTNNDLTYTANGISNVEILIAPDGASFSSIVPTTPTTGTYTWSPVPNNFIGALDSSTNVKFRIRNADDPGEASTTATTTGTITVKKRIINVSPANNTTPVSTLYVGDNSVGLSNIIWTSQGSTSNNVILNYDTNAGLDNYPGSMGGAVSDIGAFVWNVPDIVPPQSDIRVRVKSVVDDTVAEVTANFTIRGKIDQLVPSNSGLAYDYNTPISISWRNNGTLGPVTIRLATNGNDFDKVLKAALATTPNAVNTWIWNGTNDPVNFPQPVGSTYKVRVEQDNDNANVVTPSANNFKIRGVLTMTSVGSNGIWARVGETPTISWTRSPSGFGDGQLELYYSKTNATTCGDVSWTSIASNLSGTSYSSWTIPDAAAVATGFRLMVKESGACGVNTSFSVSTADSASVKGRLVSLVPSDGSQVWEIGEQYNISWTSNPAVQASNVLIEYTTNGTNYFLVTGAGGVGSNTSPFPWTIPDDVIATDLVNTVKIRVKVIDDPTDIQVVSQNNFTIKKKYIDLQVPAPTLYVGDPATITWDTKGIISPPTSRTALLSYDSVSGTGGYDDPGQPNAGAAFADVESFSWTVADSIGTTNRMRIQSPNFPNDVQAVTTDFTIRGKILVSQPTGASTLVVGSTYQLVFDKRGSIGNVKIYYNRTGCATPLEITPSGGTANATSFDWPVPALDGCATSLIDANASKNSSFFLVGDTHEKKAVQSSTNTTPVVITTGTVHGFTNGQSVTIAGHSIPAYNAVWTVANVTASTFELSGSTAGGAGTGGTVRRGTADLEASVTTPSFQIRGDIYKVGASDFVPNNGEVWSVGSPQFIKWKTNGNIGNVRIRLDKYAGNGLDGNPNTGDEFTIVLSGPAPQASGESIAYNYVDADCTGGCSSGYTGVWEWDVPDEITSQARIRVESLVTGNGYHATNPMATYRISESNFRIRGSLTVTSPATALLKVGDAISIDWISTGTVGNVNISLLTDNDATGSPYANIISIASNTSTKPFPYTLLANSAVSSYATVRVTSVIDSLATDDASEFKIFVPVTAPVNSNEWVVGSQNSITWTPPSYDTPSFKVELSTDNGATWPGTGDYLISAGDTSGDGTILWTIPSTTNLMTNEAVIRISKVGDADAKANSAGLFYIKGSITGVTPANAIDLPIGANNPDKTITWNYTGALGNVNLYYATNGNVGPCPGTCPTWQPIDITGTVSVGSGGTGSYNWEPIPDAPSANVKVKVESVSGDWLQVSGQSSGLNSIIGSITEVTAISGDSMEVGLTKTIQWKPGGSIALFGVKYRVANGSWSADLTGGGVAGTPAGLYKQWTWPNIPNNISNDVDFMVYDFADPNKVFGISAKITDSNTKGYIIKGRLSLVSPDAGPTWNLTDSNDITWNKVGSIGDIKIELSLNGTFSDSVTLVDNLNSGADGNNSWAWSTGDVGAGVKKVSETAKIRVSNTTGGTTPPTGTALTAQSASNFKIRPELVTGSITSPALNATWNVGLTNKIISWSATSATAGTIPQVTIELDSNGDGTPESTIATVNCAHGVNNYSWLAGVADERTTSAKIKISLVGYSDHNVPGGVIREVTSDAFKILPVITTSLAPDPLVSNPLGLVAGTNYPNLVHWTYTGTKIATVNVRYDVDGSETFAGVIQNAVDVADGSAPDPNGITWSIPSSIIITGTAKIRVIDVDNANVFGDFGPFKLRAGVTLTAPTANQKIVASSATNNISWSFTGSDRTVNVYYDPDDTTDSWTLIGSVDQTGNGASGTTNFNWNLSNGGTNPTNTTLVGNRYRIRLEVQDADAALKSVSISPLFKVVSDFNVSVPENGAPIYAESTSQQVTWATTAGTGIYKIHVYYSNNSEVGSPTWIRITPTALDGADTSYDWPSVPRELTDISPTTHRVRVVEFYNTSPATNPDTFVDTEVGEIAIGDGATFPILGTLTLTQPTTNDSWDANTTERILWTKKGNLETVNVYYSALGDFTDEIKINGAAINISDGAAGDAARVAGNGGPNAGPYFFDWNITGATPLTAGTVGSIRVKAATPGSQTSVIGTQTPGKIEVKGSITVDAPTGSGVAMIRGGDPYKIEWTTYGAIANVKLYYSTNGGPNYASFPMNGGASMPGTGFAGCTPAPCYEWTIPDNIGNNLIVRVEDSNNTSVFDVSDNAFEIHGSVVLDKPDAAVTHLFVGDPYDVKWTPTGTYPGSYRPLVEFHYDRDAVAGVFGGGDVEATSPATASNTAHNVQGTYSWTIPDRIGSNVQFRVRVKDSPTEVKDISDSFKIVGKITGITSPVADETWYAQDTNKPITWNATGTVTNVHIEFYNGSGWQDVVANQGGFIAGSNTYQWPTIPTALKTNIAKIRITDVNYPETTFETAYTFKIVPKLRVDSPLPGNPSHPFKVGTTYSNLIKWTQTQGTAVSTVDVFYSTDGGANYNPTAIYTDIPVADGAAGKDWTIPNAVGNNVVIKVQDHAAGFTNVNDANDTPSQIFKIAGSVTLTAPTANQKIVASSATNNISWSFTGSDRTVNVYYDPDDTSDSWTLIGSVDQTGAGASGTTNFNWNLSNGGTNPTNTTLVGNRYRIRLEVQDADAALKSVSISPLFKVVSDFNVSVPENGAPIYSESTDQQVTWATTAGTGIYKIHVYYSNNSEAGSPTWIRITPTALDGADTSYDWPSVPRELTDISPTTHRVRVVEFYNTSPATNPDTFVDTEVGEIAIGDGATFPILGTLTLTRPTTNTSWDANTTERIEWTKKGDLQSANVYYSALGDFTDEIKINTNAIDVSDSTGQGDEDINPASDVDAVNEYFYDWNITGSTPLTAGTVGKIRVKAATPGSQTSVIGTQTPGAIEVKGSITVDAPTAPGITMTYGGDPYKIRWTTYGAIANVKLYYSTNGGGNYLTYPINGGASMPGTGFAGCTPAPCYEWTVPDNIGNNLVVRVVDNSNTNVFGVSGNSFRIKGQIQIDVPTLSNLSVRVGDVMTNYIKWTPTGTFANVEIDYSTDGTGDTDGTFGTPVDISTVTNSASLVQGSANWTIPTSFISGNVRIRVRDAAAGFSDVYAISANPFKVLGKIEVTGPETGGTVWNFGDTNRAITWDATGPITNVKIQYKTSGGGSYTVLKANQGGFGAGARSWTWNVWDSGTGIPDEKSEAMYVQVLDANFATDMELDATTVNTVPFSVRPVGYFDAPAASARIVATSNNTNLIRWHFSNSADTATSGKVSSVNVEYNCNGAVGCAAGWQPVGTNPYANGLGVAGVNWNGVPDTVENNVSLRVIDTVNANVLASRTVKIVYDVDLVTPPEVAPDPKVQLKYNQGTTYDIDWTKTGAATGKLVNIRYAKDGINFNYTIASNLAAGSSPYSWNPSLDAANMINQISSTGKVRVVDTLDSETKAESAPMSVQSIFDMTAPEPISDGALTLNVDNVSTYTVRWTAQGNTAFAKLQYSIDGGTNWVDLQSADNPGASNIANNSGASPLETTYSMKVTDAMRSENFKMRVGDVADLGNGGTDAGNWNATTTSTRVRSSLSLVQPLGASPASNQALLVGSPYKIRWSVYGTMATVKLQYSIDGGAFNNITTPALATNIDAAAGYGGCTPAPCFDWTIPDTASDDVKVRVVNEQALTPEQYSESPNFFHITGQLVFNPAVPGGDTVWYVHRPGDVQQKTVNWVKTGTITNVNLEYSTDGTNFNPISGASNLTGLNHTFDVMNAIDPDIVVRAVNADATKPTILAASGNIQVLGKLTITAPATSESLDVDSTYPITWATAGTIAGTVKLEYSTDNFATAGLAVLGPANEPATALSPGAHNTTNNTFNWKVPSNINNTVKLRITANTANQTTPFTTGDFKIRGVLTLLTPNGTNLTCTSGGVSNQIECYEVDGTMGITWTRSGAITNARLQYSTDNFVGSNSGNNFTTVAVNTWDIATRPAGDLSYAWTPVYDRISETVKVRIVDADYNGTTVTTNWDESNANFALRGKIDTITLNAASITANTVALIGDDVTVAWVKHGTIPSVKVQYRAAAPIVSSSNTSPIQITTLWAHGLTTGNSVTIVGHLTNTAANGTFTVTVVDSTTYTLDGSTGNGVGGTTGSASGPFVQMLNSGLGNADAVAGTSFSWRIPDRKSLSGVTIKITNNSDTDDVFTVTSPAFTIRGGFAWTNPSATGQVFKVSNAGQATVPITWTTFGTISNIHIKYSTNNDNTYDPLENNWVFAKDGFNNDANNIANSSPNPFNWKVPDAISQTVYMVVVDASDSDAKNVSPMVKIAGVIFNDEPDNIPTQERWGITTTQAIKWTLAGSIQNLKIDYTTDGDTTDGTPAISWTEIVANADASLLSYDWVNIPPASVTTKAAIRLSDAAAGSGTDVVISPLFKIVGTINVSQPAVASVVRTTGSSGGLTVPTSNIVWSTQGAISQVDLYYSTTGGAPGDCSAGTWSLINSGGPVNNVSPYAWTVPTLFSNTVVVRIRDAADNLTCADSGVFSVRGDIQMTSPNGAEIWKVGQIQNILWGVVGSQGSPNQVFMEFQKGDGNPWSTINDPISGLPQHNNDGSTTWNVPETEVHSSVKLKIYNTVVDTDLRYKEVQSAGPFKLVRRYQITSLHSGGDVHLAGTELDIAWNKWGTVSGSYGNVLIDLTKTGADPYSQSISGGPTPNDGTFAWTPGAADVTPSARIRIADTGDTLFESPEYSASNFTIRGVLTLNAIPTTVKIGDIYEIRWQRISNSPTVILAYSKTTNFATDSNFIEDENGATVLNGEVPNNDAACLNLPSWGCHRWKVPDLPLLPTDERSTIKIRIQDKLDPYTAYDNSDPKKPQNVSNVFKIIPKFTVTFPNGNADINLTDKLKVGQIYNIAWDSSSSAGANYTPNVKVMFSTDGGANYQPADVIAGSTANGYPSGSVQWNYSGVDNGGTGVHNRIGSQLRVRVEEVGGDLAAFDQSNSDCKIISNLSINSPGSSSGVAISSSTHASPIQITTSAAHGLATGNSVTIAGHLTNTAANGTWFVTVQNATQFTLTTPSSQGNGVGGATGTMTRVYTVGEVVNFDWSNVGTVPPGAAFVHLMYSNNGNDFSSPLYIPTNTGTPTDIANNSPFNYDWTIPDQIGANVRVRVKSKIDDGDAVAAFNIRIKGNLAVTAPTTGTPVPIGQTYRILWTTSGTIPNVNIVYDTQDGAGGYPNTIATNIPNVGFFDWVNVPDTGTADARIRVIDARGAESDVIGTSNKFNIVGNFTVLTPTNGQDLIVNSDYNVTWNWGGTIRYVKVSYTTNPVLAENVAWTNITTIDYGPASGDGANGTSVRTYVWDVPDNIAPNVRFKVENANDSSVYDVSTGSFRIKGGFSFQAPTGGERWVTNEVRNVTWLTDGTVPFVNLEYSFDDFATAGISIATNVPNNGTGLTTTYPWTIPDPGIANVPKSTKIRVVNAGDPTNYQTLGTAFNIDYYNITWEIRDLVTNASLSQLTVNEVKASDPNFVQWSEAGISTNPPRVQKTPYGTWVATWSKSGFGDGVQVVVANSDQSLLLYMETSTVHIWLADSRVSYDPDLDVLNVAGWLSRDGSITTGAIASTYKIYDGATLLYTLTDNTVDSAGFFNWTVPAPTGFLAGKTYTTICEVTVGSGGVFKTPSSFQITDAKKLEEVKDTVNSVLDKPISVVEAGIQATLTAQTQTITTKLDEQTATIQTTLTNFENTISASIVSLESAADQSLVSAQTLEKTALKFSWKAVVAPNPALTGDTILLQAQGPRALFPYLSVYNNKNQQVIANGLMTEDESRPGNYSFEFPADAGSFEAGEAYTYVVTEDITGGLVAGSGFIEAISLTSVAGLAAAAPAAEKAAKEAALAIKNLREEMAKGGNIEDSMKSLKRAIDNMQSASGNSPERENKVMRERVGAIMDQLKQLAGDTGLNFDELFKKAIDESSTVQEIRSRAGQINQAVDLIGAVVEKRLGGVEEPIVDIQFEPVS